MIVGIAALLFLAGIPFVWRKGADGTGAAFGIAAIVGLATALFATATGLIRFGKDWRVEAIFCGLALAMAFVCLGTARATG